MGLPKISEPIEDMAGSLGQVTDELERIALSLERLVDIFEGVGRFGRAVTEPVWMVRRMVIGQMRFL